MNDSMGFFNRMFDYRDGKLIQKVKRPRVNVGDIAGTKDTSGHLQTMVYGRLYLVHRIIWIMLNGDIPDKMEIDHINGVRDDNRIENLRLVTKSENQRNSKLRKDSSSGIPGVGFHKQAGKWAARININGKRKRLGLFDSFEDAAKARHEAEILYGYHPNHGRAA